MGEFTELDPAVLEQTIAQWSALVVFLVQQGKAVWGLVSDAIATAHSNLTPEQRTAILDGVRANAAVDAAILQSDLDAAAKGGA